MKMRQSAVVSQQVNELLPAHSALISQTFRQHSTIKVNGGADEIESNRFLLKVSHHSNFDSHGYSFCEVIKHQMSTCNEYGPQGPVDREKAPTNPRSASNASANALTTTQA